MASSGGSKNKAQSDSANAANMKQPTSIHYGPRVAKRKERLFNSRMASLRSGGTYR